MMRKIFIDEAASLANNFSHEYITRKNSVNSSSYCRYGQFLAVYLKDAVQNMTGKIFMHNAASWTDKFSQVILALLSQEVM